MLVDMDANWCFEHYLSHRSLVSADNVRAQLKRVMERNDLEMMSTPFEDPTYYTNIRRALTCGFFMQVAKKAQGAKHYVTVKDQQIVSLHPSTVLETLPEWVIYNEYSPFPFRVKSLCLTLFKSNPFYFIPQLSSSFMS